MSGSEELKLNGDSVITAQLFGPVLVESGLFGRVLDGSVLYVFHPAVNGPSSIILDQGVKTVQMESGPIRSNPVRSGDGSIMLGAV